MTAKETLELLNKQWCNVDDIRIIAQTSKKQAQQIKREIVEIANKKGYRFPNYLISTTSLIDYLKIDIKYLEERATYEEKLLK